MSEADESVGPWISSAPSACVASQSRLLTGRREPTMGVHPQRNFELVNGCSAESKKTTSLHFANRPRIAVARIANS